MAESNRKIRTAFIYKKHWRYLSGNYWSNNLYNLFMKAIKRNSRLDVKYFGVEREFDVSKLSGFDAILLPDNLNIGSPDTLINIEKSSIPVLCHSGDPHSVQWTDRLDYHEKYKIDCYFDKAVPSYFYKFHPKKWKYKMIMFGLEPDDYVSLQNFESRIKDRILVSGAIGKQNPVLRLAVRILKPKRHDYQYYKLRTKCSVLPYVDYKFEPDYPALLSRYRAAVASSTAFPTVKYLEIPAAGCLTFMEIAGNDGHLLGFKGGENAIFIDEKNYKKKFQEYLADADNPKWGEIAESGRRYVMNNLTNDHAADQLADLMAEYIK